jgi:penicillin-binding protein A
VNTSRPHLLRVIAAALLAFAAVLASLYLLTDFRLRKAADAWTRGDMQGALTALDRTSRWPFRRAEHDRLSAIVYLSAGSTSRAEPHLRRLSVRSPELFPVIRKEEVGRHWIRRGSYAEFLAYDLASRERFEPESVGLYRAAALAATGRFDEAELAIGRIRAGSVEREKLRALRRAVDERKRGSYPLLLDRDGRTIALWVIERNDLVAVNADFTPLLDSSGGRFSAEANLGRIGSAATVETTLDAGIQRAALQALGATDGAMVVIDTRTNELLAVANSRREGGVARNDALGRLHPAGAIVKTLTAARAMDSQIDFRGFFPVTCRGYLEIEGEIYYDWAAHDSVETLDEAIAVSCGVAFAQLGMRLGPKHLAEAFSEHGFGQTADLGLMRAPLGRFDPSIAGNYALATAASGGGYSSVNALHVAMIAAMHANGGVMKSPVLVRSRRSILNERLPLPTTLIARRAASRAASARVRSALEASVTDPRGTGRRGAVEGLSIAMKPATVGRPADGYTALVMAYAPAEAPRIAIGLIVEGAGPAETAGTRIVRDFFERISGRLAEEQRREQ